MTGNLEIALLDAMIGGRAFETVICAKNDHWHPALGEEAVVVGSFFGLREDDLAVPHYRGAAMAGLIRGADMRRLYAAAFGKATAATRGRYRGDVCAPFGPTMIGHFSGCLGPMIGYGTGAAMGFRLRRLDRVAVVTFGDGTSNSGLLYESLNLAAMFQAPVVYVCQDNQYAISMPAARGVSGSLVGRAAGFGIEARQIDGNDVVAVLTAVQGATERARRGGGPTFLHALTYRQGGHWATDPAAYRPADEAAAWRQRDPIARLAGRLEAAGALDAAEVARMEAVALERARAAMAEAEADPLPGLDVLAEA